MKKEITILLLICINIFTFISIKNLNNDSSVGILDVGQGDSILIKDKNRHGLIDAGKSNFLTNVIYEYIPPLKREIDFIILTHPDLDHIEGILGLMKNFKIKSIYITKSLKNNELIKTIFEEIKSREIKTYYLNENNDFKINNFEFNIFNPTKDTDFNTDANELSIGIEISFNSCSIYTAGDLGSSGELKTFSKLKDKNIEILKVGHHGSKTSTSNEFISILDPLVAIISSGLNNSYNHPHKEVISTLSENNVKILNTQTEKSIEIIFNSGYLSLKYNNNHSYLKCL